MGIISRLFGAADTEAIPDGPYAGFGTDDFRRLALDTLMEEGLRTKGSLVWGTVEECDQVLARIPAVREKYKDIKPGCLREQISEWIDYFEGEAKRNREDCLTQANRKHYDKVGERMAEERRRVAALRQAIRDNEGQQ